MWKECKRINKDGIIMIDKLTKELHIHKGKDNKYYVNVYPGSSKEEKIIARIEEVAAYAYKKHRGADIICSDPLDNIGFWTAYGKFVGEVEEVKLEERKK